MNKKNIIPIIALILLISIVYAGDTCTYTGPSLDLINAHILREANDGGITSQCNSGESTSKSCGFCGTKVNTCSVVSGDKGIWSGWSSCQDQGYCQPGLQIPSLIINDTHRLDTSCQNNQVEYVKTVEKKNCGDECAYENIEKIDEHVSWECNIGLCGATCSSSTSEDCGRCGTLTCDNCQESCINEGICTKDTQRVSVCADCNQVKYETCDGNCQWKLDQDCGTPITEPGCNAVTLGSTKSCGYCGQQTCLKTCDETNPVYYWGSCENEYTGSDKCLIGSSISPKVISEKKPVCDGKLRAYQDTLETRGCSSQCKITTTGTTTRQTPGTAKTALIGQCGYNCDNNQVIRSGSDTGRCQAKVETCVNNQWTVTQTQITPIAEICDNNVDDDCDGQTDENCAKTVPPPPPIPLPNIDIDDNGIINQFDFKAFYEANGFCKGEAGFNPRADFNQDGCVGNKGQAGGKESDDSKLFMDKFPSGEDYLKFCGCPDIIVDGIVDIQDLLNVLFDNPNSDVDNNGILASMIDLGDMNCIAYYIGRDLPESCFKTVDGTQGAWKGCSGSGNIASAKAVTSYGVDPSSYFSQNKRCKQIDECSRMYGCKECNTAYCPEPK